LIRALDNENGLVRLSAVRALGRIGGDASRSVPKLMHLLKDKDRLVCCRAAEALGSMRKKALASVPSLKKIVDYNSSIIFRVYADDAIYRISGERSKNFSSIKA